MKKRMLIMLILSGLVFGGVFGYQAFKAYMMNKYFSSSGQPPVVVSAMPAHYEWWQPQLRAAGSVRAVQGVDISSEVSGMVQRIYFLPGQSVKAGTILVQLNADSDIAALHSLQAAAELAKTTYQRDKALYKVKAISQATLETDAANLKSKIAQVAEQAALVAKKTLRAPFSGRLGISAINLGEYLNAGNKIVTLQTLDPIFVDFYIPQQSIALLQKNQSVLITKDGQLLKGKITAIDPKVDSATRNVQVEATFMNTNGSLLPGMYAQVEVLAGKPVRYLTLPQTAVSFNPYGEIIYIAEKQGKAERGKQKLIAKQTFVTTGDRRGDQIAIVNGINENDLVVTSGQLKLQNGSTVIINNTIVPSNNPKPLVADD